MNVEMIRQNYGKAQIKLPAMSGREFRDLIESLDFARYPDVDMTVSGQNNSEMGKFDTGNNFNNIITS